MSFSEMTPLGPDPSKSFALPQKSTDHPATSFLLEAANIPIMQQFLCVSIPQKKIAMKKKEIKFCINKTEF